MTSPGFTTQKVERSIELDADVGDVWEVLAEPDELESWMGERVEIDMQPGGCGHVVGDDGVRREVLVTAVEPGRRLAWHWWEDGGELSSVEITLVPLRTGTRVDVVEVAAASGDAGPGGTGLRARACAGVPALAARLAPAGLVLRAGR
jgi:uncharacterized protein YndB with AHSA1/START domain